MTLLTVAGYKARVSTSSTDDAIQTALDASEQEIFAAAGQPGDKSERIRGGHNILMLGRRANVVISVSERVGQTVYHLDPADYGLMSEGLVVRRYSGGPNPSARWRGQVDVTYEPVIGVATYLAVQLEICALDLGDSVGATAGVKTSERIGEWSETFASGTVSQTQVERRTTILARLIPQTATFWVGSGFSDLAGAAGS